MTSDTADTADPTTPLASWRDDRLSRVLRIVLTVALATVLILAARVVGLVAMFACGEPASSIPYCTGTTAISSGWGTTDNSPLWTPGLLTVAGLLLGLALWRLAALRRHHRPLGFLVTGVVFAHVAGAVTAAGL